MLGVSLFLRTPGKMEVSQSAVDMDYRKVGDLGTGL